MHWSVLALSAFGITVLETYISSLLTQAIADRKIYPACWLAVAFELVLAIDILLLVDNPVIVTPPILVGAWVGMWWSFKRRGE